MANTGNTQQIIDYGASANDGQGDPLRTAFIKTEENFDNIWLAGPVGSNITIVNNTIGVQNTNGNLVLRPNGTGVVQSNAAVVPNTTDVRDLGSSARRWRSLYLGIGGVNTTGTLNAVDADFSGDVTIQGNLTVEGDTIQIGNITTDTLLIQLANAATTDAQANGAGVTVGINDDIATILYDSANNIWTTNIGMSVNGAITGTSVAVSSATIYGNIAAINGTFTGNVTANYFLGNGSQLTGITTYANANAAAYGEAGWAGNIIPSANAVYSLGNSSSYWSNLWVANNTIYIGGVPLGVTAGNVLTVGGEPVLTNDSDTSITTTGNITANYFTGNGSLLTGISTTGDFTFTGTTMSADEMLIQSTDGDITIQSDSDIFADVTNKTFQILADAGTWIFDGGSGATTPPILTVARGDTSSGTITGFALKIGDGTNEAIITTPDGGEGDPNSQRIVINPGKGADTSSGEGGDIYLWAGRGGDAGGSGGDVKIRGGQGMVNGAGGYIRMEGGDGQGFGQAGYITMDGGSAVDDSGGYLQFRGGYSQNNDGGYIEVRGGYSTNGEGGDVNIIGGGSDGGQGLYGNIGMQSGSQTWTFDNTGNLVLPSEGNIVGVTPNNTGHLQWVGNSSGDGGGYTTLRLVPDDTVEGGDQYLIIDPTAPGHIHIRAGGTQDNSSADLFLGGENSYFKVNAGANSDVRISANSHAWVFQSDSIFTVPGEGVIRSIGDSVTLQSYNVGTGNVQSVYLGSGGGVGFFDQDIGGNWLEIFRSGAEPQIRVPVGRGNLNVQTAEGINAYDWVFDNTGNLTAPGNITTTANIAAAYFIGNGSQLTGLQASYGNANVVANLAALSSNPISTTGNITADNFIGSGNANVLTLTTRNGDSNNSYASPQIIMGYAGTADYPSFIHTTHNASTPVDNTIEFWTSDGTQAGTFPTNAVLGLTVTNGNIETGNISATGNITAGNFIGSGSNVELVAQTEQWVFDTTGVLTVPGNITGANVVSANTFVSNAFNVVTAGNLSITSQYGLGFTGTILEDNGTLELIANGGGGVVVGWDSTYGNGLGNIATVNFNEVGGEGILLRTGNRAATEYNWNFDNSGNLTLPGNIAGNTGGFTIGYRDIPQVTFSANATAALTDAGKHYYSTTAGNLALTLPDNVSVAFPTGAALTVVVNAAGNVLVNQGTGVTLYQAGSAGTGNRVVGAYGLATVMKVAANTWVISGTGVY